MNYKDFVEKYREYKKMNREDDLREVIKYLNTLTYDDEKDENQHHILNIKDEEISNFEEKYGSIFEGFSNNNVYSHIILLNEIDEALGLNIINDTMKDIYDIAYIMNKETDINYNIDMIKEIYGEFGEDFKEENIDNKGYLIEALILIRDNINANREKIGTERYEYITKNIDQIDKRSDNIM